MWIFKLAISQPLCNSTNCPTKLSADLHGVSLDLKKVGPRFLSLFGLLAAEVDLARPFGARKVKFSRLKAK